jgi:DNA-directed RNA polymerase specialized sigma subunit
MAFFEDETHFRLFAGNLEAVLKRYEADAIPEETLLVRQRRQMKLLLSLEDKFRKALIKHPWGPSVYREFVTMILDQKRNILAARPYFRERQAVFADAISKALKKRSDKGLYRFHFNYTFILFVLNARNWRANRIGGKIVQLAEEIYKIRMEIMEMNMPLAISQARIFWSNTPKSHLSYMDLVQIHCGGLLVAIDKFVPPDTSEMTEEEELEAYRTFRAVAIGRMIGDRIEQYSETLIHFYPIDKRKIYRANKARRKMGDTIDYVKMAESVNEDVEPAHRTNPEEIAELLAASSCVSGDLTMPDGEGDTLLERYEAAAESRPDLQAEDEDAILVMRSKMQELDLIEKKLLRMRGVPQ